MNLDIDHLRLTFMNASGHEHRVASIAECAIALLAERVDERWRSSAAAQRNRRRTRSQGQ